jgi:hypothetical protein
VCMREQSSNCEVTYEKNKKKNRYYLLNSNHNKLQGAKLLKTN